jgi:hypothetical protein
MPSLLPFVLRRLPLSLQSVGQDGVAPIHISCGSGEGGTAAFPAFKILLRYSHLYTFSPADVRGPGSSGHSWDLE